MESKKESKMKKLKEKVKMRVKKVKARINSLGVEKVILDNKCLFILSAFKKMESILLSSFLISKPFAEYSRNSYKESVRRQLVRWLFIIFEMIGNIRFLILTLSSDKELWRTLGHNFYVLPDHQILTAACFGINTVATVFRLVMHWCDVKGK